MRRMILLSTSLFVLLASSLLWAKGEKREELAEKIRSYRKIVIAEELGLDQATTDKLFPVLDGYMDQMRDTRKEQKQLRKEIDAEAAKQKPDIRKLDGLLEALSQKELEFQTLKIESFQATKGILTPLQRVELLELLPDIDRRIREMIAEAKKK